MFESHCKRVAADRVNELRNAMISGAWSNSNFDGEGAPREKFLRSVDEFAENAISAIYSSVQEKGYKDFDPENPFFAAIRVPKMETMNQELPSG